MTQPQGAGEDPQAAPAPPTLRLDEAGMARAVALSESRPTPPAEILGYRIEQCLGVGAYGSVWLAVEQNTGKRVAVKFYSHRGGLDWSLLNREVEKLAALYTSRDVIGLIQVGWNADPPYYVMEYMQNGSLA
ncbi:MAG TPA: protein kinase, partial [Planctomycetaceae bacterium]